MEAAVGAWTEFVVGALLGAVVAAVVAAAAVRAWAEARHRRSEAEHARLLQQEAERRAAAEAEAARARGLERTLTEREQRVRELEARVAALETQLDHERHAAQEKLALLEQAQAKLADTFRALSAEALSHNNQAFLQLARENLERFQQAARTDLDARQKAVEELVRPLHEQVDRIRIYLTEVEKQRVGAYAALSQQLRELAESHLPRLHQETANLVKALRQPTARGRWGELQLRRVVEMAGMQAHCDFVEQATGQEEDGRLRPDLVVQLPGGRRLVVDAKTPVDAYLSAVEAPDEESRRRFLIQHASQVRAHMSQLGRKSYFEQFDVVPDFVVMFVPGEAFFSAALEVDPGLIEFGVQQRVIPASPTILIAC